MTKMPAPDSGVTVRMYRPGFGDCFLMAFRGPRGKPFYMLIDCGVHAQFRGGSERMLAVVEGIRKATGGRLDVVAVTHEHADHVSGFAIARALFETFEVGEVWFAWTEDPEHKLAKKIRRERSLMLQALTRTHQSLAADSRVAANVGGLLGFFDLPLALTTSQAQEIIAGRAQDGPRYLEPKKAPLTLPGVGGIRIFVLGPPVDEKKLRRARPSKKHSEVYEFWTGLELAQAGLSLDAGEVGSGRGHEPFAFDHRIPSRWVARHRDKWEFFHDHYGFDDEGDDAWRRIEGDWLEPAENLALKLDAATNNTSLVLAIELMESGRVLLFPGDAQVGNWLSWHDGGWSHDNGLAKDETATATDLLRRTVLYKVGHHGSHNATLRERGLELMESDELTAMIPVDEEWAWARKPYPWKMPFPEMYDELLRRTRGRILRTDKGRIQRPRNTPRALWQSFVRRTAVDDLYVELKVPDR